jgi:PhnB protein
MPVKPIPDGYTTVTPYLFIRGAAKAIDFYKKAFGATEIMRLADPGGDIRHAEIQVEGARIMLADEFPQMGVVGPQSLGGSPVCFLLYVKDADALFERAIAAGAKSLQPLKNQFYGDRAGTVADPFGHLWTIATHVEDVSSEEIQRRFETSMKEQKSASTK